MDNTLHLCWGFSGIQHGSVSTGGAKGVSCQLGSGWSWQGVHTWRDRQTDRNSLTAFPFCDYSYLISKEISKSLCPNMDQSISNPQSSKTTATPGTEGTLLPASAGHAAPLEQWAKLPHRITGKFCAQ